MKDTGRPASIALIGYGAIADRIIDILNARDELASLRGVLVRAETLLGSQARSGGRFRLVANAAELLALDADVVIEVAGHEGVRQFAPDLLAAGQTVLFSSAGVFANRAFARRLLDAGAMAKMLIAPGAVAGIDGLRAALSAGLETVTYTSWKPPAAWRSTRAAAVVERLDGRPGVFFEGTARQAALDYPQNANVAATIGLLGLGLDRTLVRLGSDPELGGPKGVIEAAGDFGSFRFEIDTRPSPNPKTSSITADSLVAAMRDGTAFNAREAVAQSLA